MSFDPTRKEPYRVSIGYGFWMDDWTSDFIRRLEVSKREYVDISDAGTARMSKRMAENFCIYLKNAVVTGSIYVEGRKVDTGFPIGVRTGEMLEGIEAFRTNLGGEKKHRGWIVSIKEKTPSSREYPLWFRLSFLEFGTKHQPARPIFAKAFEAYVGEGRINLTIQKMLKRGKLNTFGDNDE